MSDLFIDKRLLTAKELAKYTGLAEQTLRNWACKKKIPACKIGGSLRFDILEIDEWIKSKKIPCYS